MNEIINHGETRIEIIHNENYKGYDFMITHCFQDYLHKDEFKTDAMCNGYLCGYVKVDDFNLNDYNEFEDRIQFVDSTFYDHLNALNKEGHYICFDYNHFGFTLREYNKDRCIYDCRKIINELIYSREVI